MGDTLYALMKNDDINCLLSNRFNWNVAVVMGVIFNIQKY